MLVVADTDVLAFIGAMQLVQRQTRSLQVLLVSTDREASLQSPGYPDVLAALRHRTHTFALLNLRSLIFGR